MNTNKSIAICTAAVLAAALSCSRPVSSGSFVTREESSGIYVFDADFSDSTLVYDLELYIALDCDTDTIPAYPDMPVEMTWMAPSGDTLLKEKVWFAFSETVMSGSGTAQCANMYRKGVKPVECGTWRISAEIPDSLCPEQMRGLGLTAYRIEEEYGTR